MNKENRVSRKRMSSNKFEFKSQALVSSSDGEVDTDYKNKEGIDLSNKILNDYYN